MGEVLWFSVICGVVALIYGIFTSRSVINSDPGSKKMQEISNAIQEGAYAYLNRQYRTILLVGIVIFIVIAFLLGVPVAIAFLIGAVLSGATGYLGMNISVRANVRTAQASIKGLDKGLSKLLGLGL